MTERKRVQHTEYEVGYKRPPKSTQFQPGQSGNPRGRAKGVRNFCTDFDKELATRVSVTENGESKQYSKRAVIAKRMVNEAAKGNLKAATLVINETRVPAGTPTPAATEALSAIESQVFENFVLRLRRIEQSESFLGDLSSSSCLAPLGTASAQVAIPLDEPTPVAVKRARKRVTS